MAKFDKFEEMYNKFAGMTEEERSDYQKQLCKENYKILSVYHMYFEDTKKYNNKMLLVKNSTWCDSKQTGEREFLNALDYFDVDEFVYATNSSAAMNELKFFCDNGWKMDGMTEEIDWEFPTHVLSEDGKELIPTKETHMRAGVKMVRA